MALVTVGNNRNDDTSDDWKYLVKRDDSELDHIIVVCKTSKQIAIFYNSRTWNIRCIHLNILCDYMNNIHTLDLGRNNLNGYCFAPSLLRIASTLSCNKSLVKLILHSNNLFDNFMAEILKSMVKNTTMEYLDLSNNMIACKGAEMISDINKLKCNNTLTTIILHSNMIDCNGIKAFEYARNNGLQNLTTFDISKMREYPFGDLKMF